MLLKEDASTIRAGTISVRASEGQLSFRCLCRARVSLAVAALPFFGVSEWGLQPAQVSCDIDADIHPIN